MANKGLRAERSRLGDLFRATARRARAGVDVLRFEPDKPASLAAQIATHAAERPDVTALWFEGRRISYGAFDAEIDRYAALFAERGLVRGDCVGILMTNRPAFLAVLFGLNRIGVAAALLNTSLRGAALRHAVRAASPAALVVGSECADACGDAAHGVDGFGDVVFYSHTEAGSSDERGSRLPWADELSGARPRREAPSVEVLGGDLFAYIYTSGTTGLPKAGKILNARALMARYAFGGVVLALSPDDTMYVCLPLFHSNGLLVASASAFGAGATVALARGFSASGFWDDIRASRATVFCYIGEVCRYLCAQPPRADDGDHALRAVVGNGLRPEVWEEFVERFRPGRVHEFYGATEGNVVIFNLTGRFGSVGRMVPIPALDNTLLVRFDPETETPVRNAKGYCIPCKAGEVGELLGRIDPDRATQRFDGYADEAATEKKVLRDVRRRGDAYFRTGDLLRKDRLGFFYFVDRIGDTFRWKGENVSTNEVADAIARFPAVRSANVYGVNVPGADGKAGMATLVAHDGEDLDPASLYEHLDGALPRYARPVFLRIADSPELTTTFKLRKVDLARQGFDPAAVEDPLWFRDDAERTYLPLDNAAHAAIVAGTLTF